MDATYRVVFCGDVIAGFELSSVKQTAEVRLKAPPAMLAQLFSGRRVILKKGVSLDIGSRYLQELESMGMKASLEPETEAPAAPVAGMSVQAPPAPAPVPKDLGSYAPPTESSVFDTRNAPVEATIVVASQHPPMRAPVPAAEQTVFVPRADISERPAPAPGSEPTVFVPRSDSTKHSFDSERTLIASAETLAEYFTPKGSSQADDPSLLEDSGATAAMPDVVEHRDVRGSNDKTVLAPPAPAPAPQPAAASQPYRTGSSETTVFVAPRRGTSDPTMTGAQRSGLSDEARRNLMEQYERDDQEEIDARTQRSGKGRTILVLLVLLAAIGAAAYYYLYMQ